VGAVVSSTGAGVVVSPPLLESPSLQEASVNAIDKAKASVRSATRILFISFSPFNLDEV
jgi:hypothetical protein